jgi:hypothetical protein
MSISTEKEVDLAYYTFSRCTMPKLEEINFDGAQIVVENLKKNSGSSIVSTLNQTFALTDLSNLKTINLRNTIIALNNFVEDQNQYVVPMRRTFYSANLSNLTSIYFPKNLSKNMIFGGGKNRTDFGDYIFQTFKTTNVEDPLIPGVPPTGFVTIYGYENEPE